MGSFECVYETEKLRLSSCKHSKEPCKQSKEPCKHSKEPYTHSKEQDSLLKDPYTTLMCQMPCTGLLSSLPTLVSYIVAALSERDVLFPSVLLMYIGSTRGGSFRQIKTKVKLYITKYVYICIYAYLRTHPL